MAKAARRILVVDDDAGVRIWLGHMLTEAGYEVILASSFDEGRRALAEQAPDLLVADVRLGTFNGLHLVAAGPPGLPSIILTGFADLVLEAEALRLGANYLTKPISTDVLLTLIKEKLASADKKVSHGSTRRWDRKRVPPDVSAHVGEAVARLVDVSYGGVRFEIELDEAPPPSFNIQVSSPSVSVDVDLVWESQADGRHWTCGAAVSSRNAAAMHQWVTLVDTLPSLAS